MCLPPRSYLTGLLRASFALGGVKTTPISRCRVPLSRAPVSKGHAGKPTNISVRNLAYVKVSYAISEGLVPGTGLSFPKERVNEVSCLLTATSM